MTEPSERTHETIQPAHWREVILTFAGAVVLVLLCNLFVAPRLLMKSPNLAGWIIGFKWHLLQDRDKAADWLILGDSSCNQGVDPAVMTTELGGDAINLCTIGDMLAVNDAWMLDWHIQHYGPPRSVLMVHVYDVWHRSFEPVRMGSVPLDYWTLRRLNPPVNLKRHELRNYLETRYFPLYANNLSLQGLLRVGDPNQPTLSEAREVNRQGFLAAHEPTPDNVRQDSRSHVRWLEHTTQTKISDDNARALRQIAALAERYNFDVYLAPAPMYAGLAADPSFQKYYAILERELNAFAGGRLHLLLDTLATYPAESMQNADHVLADAAKDYTMRLVAEIQAIRSARASTGDPRKRVTPMARPGASSSALMAGKRTTR
jgi:hypothetical protein